MNNKNEYNSAVGAAKNSTGPSGPGKITLSSVNTDDHASSVEHNIESQANESSSDANQNVVPDVHQTETVRFNETITPQMVSVEGTPDPIGNLPGHDRSSIDGFVMRPVRIASTTWTNGSTLDVSVNPWALLLNNAALKRKIDNFHLFRASIVISVKYSATPFHMGLLHCIYDPVPGNRRAPSGQEPKLCMYSQRPGTREKPINISTNQAFTMKVPFVAANEFIDVGKFYSATDYDWIQNMALFRLFAIDILKMANGDSEDIELSIFAHFEDMELYVPAVQASAAVKADEAPTTWQERLQNINLSGVTSALASASGYLAEIPSIAPYAIAGQTLLEGTTQALQFLGFSRPGIVADPAPYKNLPVSTLAHTSGGDNSSLLSFDPQQSVSIDPTVLNLDSVDQMDLRHVAKTWSFMGSAAWDLSDPADFRIVDVGVSPCTAVIPISNPVPLTSCYYAALPFARWSGTMYYKVKFNATRFHSGKVALIYSPDGSVNSVDDSNVTYTEIIDIKDTDEFVFSISWSQGTSYLHTDTTAVSKLDDTGIIYNSNTMNGLWSLRVLTQLRAPSNGANLLAQVYCCMGDDLEFAMPHDSHLQDKVYAVPTSGDYAPTHPNEFLVSMWATEASGPVPSEVDQPVITLSGLPDVSRTSVKPRIYFGEKITSFRSLIKRYSFSKRYLVNVAPAATSVEALVTMELGYFPQPQTASVSPFQRNTMLNYVSAGYYGFRGDVRWKVVVSTHPNIKSMLNAHRSLAVVDGATSVISTSARNNTDNVPLGYSGTLLSHADTQPCVEIASPFYSRFKCSVIDNLNDLAPNVAREDEFENCNVGLKVSLIDVPETGEDNRELCVYVYAAGGDSADFVWYLGAPARS